MANESSVKADMIVPEIFAEAVEKEFASLEVFKGTGGAEVATGLPSNVRGGDMVEIPMFDLFAGMQALGETDAIEVRKMTMSKDEAPVVRVGNAFSMSQWARMAAAGKDPYEVGAAQLRAAVAQEMDNQLIVAAQRAGTDLNTLNISAISGSNTLSYDAITDAFEYFGDNQDVACIAVHPSQLSVLRKLRGSDGNTLYVDAAKGGTPFFHGAPVVVSSKLVKDGTDVYSTLVVKKGALAGWYTEAPELETVRDPALDKTSVFVNVYLAAVRRSYSRGSPKSGVCVIKHK